MLSILLWNLTLATLFAIVLSVLQGTGIARRRPAVWHALWLLVMLKLVSPPLIPVPLLPSIENRIAPAASQTSDHRSLFSPASSESLVRLPQPATTEDRPAIPVSTEIARPDNSAAPQPFRGLQRIPALEVASAVDRSRLKFPALIEVLVGISLSGTLLSLVCGFWRVHYVNRLMRSIWTSDTSLTLMTREIALRMGIKPVPQVCVIDANLPPLLWPFQGSTIVIPQGLMNSLRDLDLQSVLAHELAHLRRRDHWANFFALAVRMLMWWNPVAWWAYREIRNAQELCCDSVAIQAVNVGRKEYARTLLRVMDSLGASSLHPPAFVVGFGSNLSLKRRFIMIGDPRVSHRLSFWTVPFLIVMAVSTWCWPTPMRAQTAPDLPEPASESALRDTRMTRKPLPNSLRSQILAEGGSTNESSSSPVANLAPKTQSTGSRINRITLAESGKTAILEFHLAAGQDFSVFTVDQGAETTWFSGRVNTPADRVLHVTAIPEIAKPESSSLSGFLIHDGTGNIAQQVQNGGAVPLGTLNLRQPKLILEVRNVVYFADITTPEGRRLTMGLRLGETDLKQPSDKNSPRSTIVWTPAPKLQQSVHPQDLPRVPESDPFRDSFQRFNDAYETNQIPLYAGWFRTDPFPEIGYSHELPDEHWLIRLAAWEASAKEAMLQPDQMDLAKTLLKQANSDLQGANNSVRKESLPLGERLSNAKTKPTWEELFIQLKVRLTPSQIRRLEQLLLQKKGFGVFVADRALLQTLEVTEEQLRLITNVVVAHSRRVSLYQKTYGRSAASTSLGIKSHQHLWDNIYEILTFGQRQQYESLRGEPFLRSPHASLTDVETKTGTGAEGIVAGGRPLSSELNGVWKVVRMSSEGVESGGQELGTWTIQDNQLQITTGDSPEVAKSTLKFNSGVKPLEIDWTIYGPLNQEFTLAGIYMVDSKGLLRLCFRQAKSPNRTRPVGYADTAGSGLMTIELVRVYK